MTLVWRPGFQFDADASTYIEAVEVADGQALETGVRYAINDFVIGCKQDGIWDAIKASCIMAGARTLNGALVPLVGTAPTNYNFVAGDYDREIGLKGDGSTKYLDSNRANDADPQNNKHIAVWVSQHHTRNQTRADIGSNASTLSGSQLITTASQRYYRINWSSGVTNSQSDTDTAAGFWGASRSGYLVVTGRYAGSNKSFTDESSPPNSNDTLVFSREQDLSDARLSFYSIGESLDLALLDDRVTDLMTAIGAAIP